jgi:hypothetical protein
MVFWRSRWTWLLLAASGLTVGMTWFQPGSLIAVASGEEACPPTEQSLQCRIQTLCRRVMGPSPYRPFDDHYPRFHPVPTSPVFPSLFDGTTANPGAGRPGRRSDIKAGPMAVPDREAPEPAPLPELVPTPPAKPGELRIPNPPSSQRQTTRRNWGATSWIFLPAGTSGEKPEGLSGRTHEVATEGGLLVR